MDLADGFVASAWRIHPFRDVSVRSTSDTLNVDVTGGIVVASHVAAVVDGDVGRALCGCNGVGERHTAES